MLAIHWLWLEGRGKCGGRGEKSHSDQRALLARERGRVGGIGGFRHPQLFLTSSLQGFIEAPPPSVPCWAPAQLHFQDLWDMVGVSSHSSPWRSPNFGCFSLSLFPSELWRGPRTIWNSFCFSPGSGFSSGSASPSCPLLQPVGNTAIFTIPSLILWRPSWNFSFHPNAGPGDTPDQTKQGTLLMQMTSEIKWSPYWKGK